MYYNLVVSTDFKQKLNEYRARWMETRRKNKSDFARWLGYNPNTVNGWITGGYIPDGENLDGLSKRIGPQVYEWAGRINPNSDKSSPLDGLPEEFISALLEMRKSWTEELSSKGIENDSPESKVILKTQLLKLAEAFPDTDITTDL